MLATTLKPPMLKPQGKSHVILSRPAPTQGINTIDPLAQMGEGFAVEMDNMIAQESGVSMREGFYEYAYNIDGGNPVRTVVSYDATPPNSMGNPLVESELFAVTDHGIFLVEGGANCAGLAPMIALSGTANAGRMSCVQFTTNGGNYLIACSEVDGAFLYDGVTWIKMHSTGGPAPGVISGVDPALFVQVVAWKKRLGFVQRESSKAWFLPVDVVGGAASVFDFGPLLEHGGVLLAMLNWTQDAGSGVDDRLVILGSLGDLAVYTGSDPTNPSAFACAGVWYVGQMPIGRRNFTNTGGNIYIVSQAGVVPVSQIVGGGLDNIMTADTDMLKQLRMLQELLRRDFSVMINTDGWEIRGIQAKASLVLLRPRIAVTDYVAYLFQIHNLAWCRLTDIPIRTIYQRLSEVYGGTDDGRVLRVLDGHSDGKLFDGSGAYHVRAKVTPAFSYYGDPNVMKQALMLRPVFLAAGSVDYDCKINADFYISQEVLTPVETTPVGSLWDSARWDEDYWAPDFKTTFEWRCVSGLGYALTPTLFVSSQVRCVLTSIEHMLRAGGPF